MDLSINSDSVSRKIYYKHGGFDFYVVYLPFLDGEVSRRPSYGVYASHLIRFARTSLHVSDLKRRYKFLTAKLIRQGYLYHTSRKHFQNFTVDTLN